jgi:D-glycero-alpha-D-manno-heptose 1-phosphate guanylyltransferase
MTGSIPEEAVILVGGLGTRLRSAVNGVPKPLAPVAGRPFLFWLLDALAAGGVRRAILATGYLGHMVEATVGNAHGPMSVLYSREETPLGTGGALWRALGLARGDRVFALNGDTFQGLDLAAMAALAPSADMVMAVRPVPDRARYGTVRLEGAHVRGFEEKGGTGPGLVNAGIYLLRRNLPAQLPPAIVLPQDGIFSFEEAVLRRAPGSLDLRAFLVVSEAFIDIGTPEDHARAQTLLPHWARGTQ